MGCTEAGLRLYRTGDLLAIVQLDELCFSEEFRFDRQAMREFAEGQDAITLIAEDETGGLVGFVIAHLEGPTAGRYAYVVTLDVRAEKRRGGVGGRLMNEMEERVRSAGAVWIVLHVFAKNDGAIQFYERRGYHRVGTKTGFYGRDRDAWVYRKDL